MNRKFRYLARHDREEIKCLHNRGATVAVIADKISAHTAIIYRELSNGYERDADGEPVIDAYGRQVYYAEIAQRTFERNIKNRGKWAWTKWQKQVAILPEQERENGHGTNSSLNALKRRRKCRLRFMDSRLSSQRPAG